MIYKERSSPLWRLWRLWFRHADLSQCLITFGSTCYIPPGARGLLDRRPDAQVHEVAHYLQMRGGILSILGWHLIYRLSRRFRLDMEVEAFQRQYNFGKDIFPSYREKMVYLNELAAQLANPAYELRISEKTARDLIQL